MNTATECTFDDGALLDDDAIDPGTTLFVPRRSRFVRSWAKTDDGRDALVLFFADKEITFDEPELFPFAERLCEHDRFVAESACLWSKGEPHAWDRVKPLLEALLAEGLLSRGEEPLPAPLEGNQDYLVHEAAEAAREAPDEPLWWNPDCARVMETLTGEPIELGYLETIVPVYRVAHPALDAEGRHVGEMNVFPAAMRMRRATETRFCKYPGGRFDYPLPMNLTALNTMRRHWRAMLGGVLRVREEVLRRYPLADDGAWRLGDLHALACSQLAVASLLLLRADDPVPNGALDPVLSSIFRVSDGVRMVAAYALNFIDDPRPYDSPITAAELLRVTEARDHFLTNHGACAGPPKMIDELLATLMDGRALEGDPAPLGPWVDEIPRAVDYALLGIAMHALVSSLWLRMALAYGRMRVALLDVADDGSPLAKLRARVERDWESMAPSHLDRPAQCAWEEARFGETFERALRGVRGAGDVGRLRDALTPPEDLLGASARGELLALLAGALGPSADAGVLDELTDATLDYLRVERAVLVHVDRLQRRINALLGRAHPARPLRGADLALGHTLRAGMPGALPYVVRVWRDELGLDVDNTAAATRLALGPRAIALR